MEQAGALYQKILQIEPKNVDALHLLSGVASKTGHFKSAEDLLKKAITIKSDVPEFHNNLGYVLQMQRRPAAAMPHYRRALELNPAYPNAHLNLANSFRLLGRLDNAITHYKKALELDPGNFLSHTNYLNLMNFSSRYNRNQIFQEHVKFGEYIYKSLNPTNPGYTHTRDRTGKIRIGYISADFRTHSVAYYIEPILANHDSDNFEIFAYYNYHVKDAITQRLETFSHHWRDIQHLSDTAIAKIIHNDKIDILVDLSGHTADNRLGVFVYKPAPIQVTYLGYPNTTGISTMDYRLTDEVTDPTGTTEAFHTEKLIRLPTCFCCYQPPDSYPNVAPLPALDTGHITFGSFNNFAKVTPEVISLWARLLTVIPDARIVLKSSGLDEIEQQRYIREEFAKFNISAKQITLLGNDPDTESHLQRYGTIDIGLDPFPYNGTTTTCEALWMGVPVITLKGRDHRSRVGSSLLTAITLSEFIANSLEDYVGIARTMFSNLPYLAKLRSGLREQMQNSPLMDYATFTKQLEDTYRGIWEKWCKNA